MIWRDRHARIERGEGVLEDDLHARAQRPHLRAALVVDRLAVEEDFAALVSLIEPDQRLAEGGLARAGLADEAERLVRACSLRSRLSTATSSK